jgi:DNA repair protein SbcC/Rad50
MQIKSLSLAPFAGIHRLELDFETGLNVLLGPNEAGKSTVVEALYAALFQSTRLKRSVKADLEFQRRAWRYPSGDHAYLQLQFLAADTVYTLTKHWQHGKSYTGLFDGSHTVVDEEVIVQRLSDYLQYGASTYANVLFARQHTFRNTLEQLQEDSDTSATVGQILKKAVMQLDGVSVEALRSRLEMEIDQLGKRWDLAENRPENNRTIQNPYKTGLGEVLKAYYDVQTLHLDLAKARRGEEEQEALNTRLSTCQREQETVLNSLSRFEAIEQQVIERDTLQLKLVSLEKDYQQLLEVNKVWPVKEAESVSLAKSITGSIERVAKLKAEWEKTQQAQLLIQDRTLLKQLESLQKDIQEAEAMVKSLEHIEEEDFRNLEKQESILSQTQAAMEAATLLGTLEKAAGSVTITDGFGRPQALMPGQQVTASGSLRLEMGEGGESLAFQISAGQIDFVTLKETFEKAAAEKTMLLDRLKAATVEEARSQLQIARDQRTALDNLKQARTKLTRDKDVAAIRRALENFGEEHLRPLKVVDEEKEAAVEHLNEQLRRQSILQNQLEQWEKAYGSHDNLMENLLEIRGEIKEKENTLSLLAKLPEEFETTSAFREHMRQLRQENSDLADNEYSLKHQLTELQHSLPPDSAEEMARALQDAEKLFKKRLLRLKRFTAIRETLEKVLEQMDQHSAKPLEEAFRRYLEQITSSRYQAVQLEDSLQVAIQQHAHAVPVKPFLFSAGTYDTVALAFRFALIDQLFDDRAAFLVLDDSLVNLDPDRKARTIALIREQAQRHQLIFTTCQPETARQLGGHLIQLRF